MLRKSVLHEKSSAQQSVFTDEGALYAHRSHNISTSAMENLWVRLKAGKRIRPRDAQMLRQLGVPPFKDSGVYELCASGYVVAVGMPDVAEAVDDGALLRAFENRFGVPVSFSSVFFRKVI